MFVLSHMVRIGRLQAGLVILEEARRGRQPPSNYFAYIVAEFASVDRGSFPAHFISRRCLFLGYSVEVLQCYVCLNRIALNIYSPLVCLMFWLSRRSSVTRSVWSDASLRVSMRRSLLVSFYESFSQRGSICLNLAKIRKKLKSAVFVKNR